MYKDILRNILINLPEYVVLFVDTGAEFDVRSH